MSKRGLFKNAFRQIRSLWEEVRLDDKRLELEAENADKLECRIDALEVRLAALESKPQEPSCLTIDAEGLRFAPPEVRPQEAMEPQPASSGWNLPNKLLEDWTLIELVRGIRSYQAGIRDRSLVGYHSELQRRIAAAKSAPVAREVAEDDEPTPETSESTKQCDALREAAEMLVQQFPMGSVYEGLWNINAAFVCKWNELVAAIALCEPKEVT